MSFVYRDVIAAGGWYRNAAHVVEFGFVGLFASASAVLLLGRRAGERTLIGSTAAFCAVSSLTDQVHKLFVPGREFELVDLLLDAIGYVGAITLVFAASRIARVLGCLCVENAAPGFRLGRRLVFARTLV